MQQQKCFFIIVFTAVYLMANEYNSLTDPATHTKAEVAGYEKGVQNGNITAIVGGILTVLGVSGFTPEELMEV